MMAVRVVIVGVCASGKTTLVNRLRQLGVDAHNVMQEHSGVQQLWRRKCPDLLVMLDATLAVIRQRRSVPWGEERLVVQRERLVDARAHADLFIATDNLTKEQVAQTVIDFIRGRDHGSNHCSRFEAGP
jgi:deoxyadenosine/deoxycytidine kinase